MIYLTRSILMEMKTISCLHDYKRAAVNILGHVLLLPEEYAGEGSGSASRLTPSPTSDQPWNALEI